VRWLQRCLVLASLLLALAGCGSEPAPVVGDNPASANGRKADDVSTPEQKAHRAATAPKGNPW